MHTKINLVGYTTLKPHLGCSQDIHVDFITVISQPALNNLLAAEVYI